MKGKRCSVRGEDKTWTRGSWTPTLDRVHGPLFMDRVNGPFLQTSWSMDSFFKIMRNEQNRNKIKNNNNNNKQCSIDQ